MASRPARTIADGVDLSQHIRSAAGLRAADKTFAVRYVSPDTPNHPEKRLRAAERDDCLNHGVALAVVWETSETRATAGRVAGAADAAAAVAVVKSLDMWPMPIHWAIDFDATGAQVEQYARGWVDVLGVDRCGAYGGIRPLAYLLDRNLITYAWQAYAWSDGQLEPRATAYQWLNGQTVAGNSVDLDAALARDFGQWPRPTNPPDQGVDMALTDADAALVAAKVWSYKPGWPGLVDETPLGMLNDLKLAQAGEAAAHASLAAKLDALAAALAEHPAVGLSADEVRGIFDTELGRTSLTVAPPTAGASGG